MLTDGDTFEAEGRTFLVRVHRDDDMGPPWEEHDGHGPVTGWERRKDKLPGELVLCEDRGSRRFYDFQEACRIARRDGWGWLPGDLETFRDEAGMWHARVKAQRLQPALFESVAADINEAIRATYAAHRATMTARAYAAGAARQNFERLRKWCADQWFWVGVEIELLDRDGDGTGEKAALWGIESDAGDYLDEVARELVAEIAFPRLVATPAEA